MTKATPLEIFWSKSNKFLKKIKNNIIKYYEKSNKESIELDLDNKVLIRTNISVKKLKKDNLILLLLFPFFKSSIMDIALIVFKI